MSEHGGVVANAPAVDLASPVTGLLQRTCDCGEHAGGGQCAECREEREHDMLQRAPATLARPAVAPPIVHGVLRESGRPLDPETRADMEASLGCDFADVRVHADTRAAGSARAVGALAYAVGSHVVFGTGSYAPATDPGRGLLAHELAHVAQQRAGNAAAQVPGVLEVGAPDSAHEHDAERAAQRVQDGASAADELAPDARAQLQRRVAPNYATIKDRLTYGFRDWAITDADAHDVLVILHPLPDVDLADTVGAMERDGLVDRLFDNASDEDKIAEAETLQRVQNHRVFARTHKEGATTVTLTAVGSCSPERTSIVSRAFATALGWLDTAIARLNEFVALPLSRRGQEVAASLQGHFHTGSPFHGELVRGQLQRLRSRLTSQSALTTECAAPTDPLCSAIAAAYVHEGHVLRWCPSYFAAGPDWQASTIVHESAHALLQRIATTAADVGQGVTDRAYFQERIYPYLRPEEAMDNADCYALFTHELATGLVQQAAAAGRPQDELADCPAGSAEMVRPAIAFVARWNLNAINVLGDPRPVMRADNAPLRRTHFGSDDPARIKDLLEKYQAVRTRVQRAIPFECERAGGPCAGNTIGYFRSFIVQADTLHLCPRWFGIGDVERRESLYALVFRHSAGVSQADADKYVGLARDLSARYWRAPGPLPSEPFPTTTTPGAEVA